MAPQFAASTLLALGVLSALANAQDPTSTVQFVHRSEFYMVDPPLPAELIRSPIPFGIAANDNWKVDIAGPHCNLDGLVALRDDVDRTTLHVEFRAELEAQPFASVPGETSWSAHFNWQVVTPRPGVLRVRSQQVGAEVYEMASLRLLLLTSSGIELVQSVAPMDGPNPTLAFDRAIRDGVFNIDVELSGYSQPPVAQVAGLISTLLDLEFIAPLPTFTPIGQGCAGMFGEPTLAPDVGAEPKLGFGYPMVLSNLPNTNWNTAFGVVSVNTMSWNGLPLPADLGFLGMPGCTIYVDPWPGSVLLPNLGGYARWTLPLPPQLDYIGARMFVQALVIEPGANPLGARTTNAGELYIGL